MSLAQGNNTPTRPRIEPGSPDPVYDALTIRPVRPPCGTEMLSYTVVHILKIFFYYFTYHSLIWAHECHRCPLFFSKKSNTIGAMPICLLDFWFGLVLSTFFHSFWDGATASCQSIYQYFGNLKVSCSRTLYGGRGIRTLDLSLRPVRSSTTQ